MWTRIGAPHESLVSISLDRGDVGKDFMVEIDTHTGNGVDLTWIVKLGTPSHPHESLVSNAFSSCSSPGDGIDNLLSRVSLFLPG